MKKFRFDSFGTAAAAFSLLVLLVSGCATGSPPVEAAFGTETENAGVTMRTLKSGEGEFQVVVTSTAAEDLDLNVRVTYPDIGFDYSSGSGSGSSGFGMNSSNMLKAKFELDGARQTIRSGEEKTVTVRLTNRHEVNRKFDFTLKVSAEGTDLKRRFTVLVADTDLFTDLKYLRQLNKTDYTNPRVIGENWEKYLDHIGK